MTCSMWCPAGAAGRRAAACRRLRVHNTPQRTSEAHAGTGQDTRLGYGDTAADLIVTRLARGNDVELQRHPVT